MNEKNRAAAGTYFRTHNSHQFSEIRYKREGKTSSSCVTTFRTAVTIRRSSHSQTVYTRRLVQVVYLCWQSNYS